MPELQLQVQLQVHCVYCGALADDGLSDSAGLPMCELCVEFVDESGEVFGEYDGRD
jgi:hypothetical protein